MSQNQIRIGVFYDGSYFQHMSNYLMQINQTNTHIDLKKFNQYIQNSVAATLRADNTSGFIVGGHYFRGKFVEPTPEQDAFYNRIEHHLYNAGITAHYIPMHGNREKGVDVELALTALEESMLKMYDVIALVAGDEDFVPLVRKISKHGVRTILFCFDNDDPDGGTKSSWLLNEAVLDSYEMQKEVSNTRSCPDIFSEVSARSGTQRYVPQPVEKKLESAIPCAAVSQSPEAVKSPEASTPRTVASILRNVASIQNRDVAARAPLTVKMSSAVPEGYFRTQATTRGFNFGFLEHPTDSKAVVYMNPRSFRDSDEYMMVEAFDLVEYRIVEALDKESGKTLYNARDARRVVL